MRVGIDIDGVVADFNNGYRDLVHKLTDFRMPEVSATFPHTWDYDKALGMDPKDISACWNFIRASDDFWLNLAPLEGAMSLLDGLSWLPKKHDMYFITSRPGRTSKDQTERWLKKYGFEGQFPTVLISSRKGTAAAALNLTHYIDDRDRNCEDVVRESPTTKTFLLAAAYNQPVEGTTRIQTLTEFSDVLQKEL